MAPTPARASAEQGRAPPGRRWREVRVSGSAELSAGPDRARVSVWLGCRKVTEEAARTSVTRRIEFITHRARVRGVTKENITVTEDFSRVENIYQMEALICITFSDFGKMQEVCKLLTEKLGTSVTISPPNFYHTPEALDTLRRQVCVAAVRNTRGKAQEVCQLFGQSLGRPLLIREEETKEWEGHVDSPVSNSLDSLTLQERIQNATAYASCRVFAVFEIRGKANKKNKLL
ncbi:interleukin-1 receptor-associated kinase 1-binding protein 1 [Phaenicophaeus curvirostris]|uniref:interleukin-1 receptor-associated kinase 1-binding protein 1 n=1 Tax=Phaenicophaeus curvirostris TaxID=33595 RepID=UPI0037F0DBDA